MIDEERCFVGSEDGKSVSFWKEEADFVGLDVTIKWKYVLMAILRIAILCIAIIYIVRAYNNKYPEQKKGEIQDTIIRNDGYSPIGDDGCVFAKSSSEALTEEAVLALRNNKKIGFQRLLRMSINEIYARHGQEFKEGEENAVYYQKYDWYKESTKHAVEWNEFNYVEKINLRLLISIEEEFGYRKNCL